MDAHVNGSLSVIWRDYDNIISNMFRKWFTSAQFNKGRNQRSTQYTQKEIAILHA